MAPGPATSPIAISLTLEGDGMLAKTVKVKNFRCAKDETLNCESLTALVGANGSGKSTFLRALQLFYDTSPKVDHRDFYDEDVSQPIEIAVTFSDLGPEA